jgi:hypothetical protein
MGNLKSFLRGFGFAAVLSCAIAAPAKEANLGHVFFKEIDNSTWVFGNGHWNVTQGRQYATKLFYKGQDLVGDAVGHYVSYSNLHDPVRYFLANPTRWRCFGLKLDIRCYCRLRSRLDQHPLHSQGRGLPLGRPQ